jgi:hypothetical protein
VLFNETERKYYLESQLITELDCLSDAQVTSCTPVSVEGTWQTLPEYVVNRLRRKYDVVIRLGFGLLKGRVLSAPEYGVLSTHGSDIRKYRGMGPKISFIKRDKNVSVTLQQLSENIDGGKIIQIDSRKLPDTYTLDDVWGPFMTCKRKFTRRESRTCYGVMSSRGNPSDLGRIIAMSYRKKT